MSISDVIKKSFMEQINSADVSTSAILLVLFVAAVLGIYLFFVYRLTCRKAFYSKSFAISLVVVAMITSLIIITVQASIVISLGMVGALSIVRFRTAIKEPMDLAYMFWAISIGIICGAKLYEVAIVGTIVITIVMLFLHLVPNMRPELLLVVNAANINAEADISAVLKRMARYYKVKSRNITPNGVDMIIELKTKEEAELVKEISQIQTVSSVTLMTHEGEKAL